MPTAAIALGSNIGDRRAHVHAAFQALGALPDSKLLASSDLFETAPVGPVPQGHYLNAAAKLETWLPPRALLEHLLAIEKTQGRDRGSEQRWGPRTLDLDLLLYDGLTIDEPGLQIPHPRLHERLFVLEPLARVWPDAVVPGHGRTVAQLLHALRVPSAR
ncbi:MAG TPA: 2-amino-4-hydroxy-6-hydroxymethyldihydropteridine diphosphokinase [Phycisphaerales bacterium]|nr:2-amino-4-hydroxy-6-hydroxymethyldihydropteridine diphosphokinase [Phycisphaerales bacterium]